MTLDHIAKEAEDLSGKVEILKLQLVEAKAFLNGKLYDLSEILSDLDPPNMERYTSEHASSVHRQKPDYWTSS